MGWLVSDFPVSEGEGEGEKLVPDKVEPVGILGSLGLGRLGALR